MGAGRTRVPRAHRPGSRLHEADRPDRPGRRALVLSHLPYRVARLELRTGRPEGTAHRPGETVEVTVPSGRLGRMRGARPGKHVIRVDVTNPAGEEAGADGGNFAPPAAGWSCALP